MLLIIIISYLLLIIIIRIAINDIISKKLLIVYISYWCLSLFLCALNFKGYYEVEDETYFLLLAHLFMFLIGFIVIRPASKYKSIKCDLDTSKLLGNYLFLGIFIVFFIYVASAFIRQRGVIALYGVSGIRGDDFYELVIPKGQFSFFSTIITSFNHFSICMMYYLLFFNRRWLYISFFFAFSLLFALLGGGRNQFMIFIYYAVSMYIVKDFVKSSIRGNVSKYRLSNKQKYLFCSIIFSAIVGMSYFTSLRNYNYTISSDTLLDGFYDTSEVFVTYSVGPIVAFDRGIKMEKFNKEHFWGAATFCGFEQLAYKSFFKYIFPNYKISYDNVTGYIQHNRISISKNSTWNYAYTSCFYYFCDFGTWGILIMPFLLGLVSRCIINVMEKNLNIFTLALFLFLCFLMYMTVFAGYLHKNVTIIYVVSLFISYFFSRKR